MNYHDDDPKYSISNQMRTSTPCSDFSKCTSKKDTLASNTSLDPPSCSTRLIKKIPTFFDDATIELTDSTSDAVNDIKHNSQSQYEENAPRSTRTNKSFDQNPNNQGTVNFIPHMNEFDTEANKNSLGLLDKDTNSYISSYSKNLSTKHISSQREIISKCSVRSSVQFNQEKYPRLPVDTKQYQEPLQQWVNGNNYNQVCRFSVYVCYCLKK